MERNLFAFILSLTIFSFSSLFSSAYGLDIGSATQEIDRSFRREIEKRLKKPSFKPPEIELEEPVETKGPRFFVREIHLTGTESFPPEEFKFILEKYENKEVSLGDLNQLAKEIQREYLRRGIITACFIPPQKVEDEVVTLRVVESRMGKLNIKMHGFFKESVLRGYWSIKEGEILRYDEIVRSLYLLNKNPDRECRIILHAGQKPYTTDVELEVKSTLPLHFAASWDNEGVMTSGTWRQGFSVRHNNFLGFDDTLIAGYKYGKHFSVPYVYHAVPLTKHGTTLLYGYSYGKSSPKKQFEPFAIDSRSRISSVTVYQDLFKAAEYIGNLNLGIDFKDKSIRYTGGTLYKERLRILRLGADFIHQGLKSVTYISPQISQGLNLWGASRGTDLSTRNAENTFSKFNLDFRQRRKLFSQLKIDLRLRSQFASEKLTSQEEFALGGINSVRGYPSADYLADNALQGNLELLIPAFFIPEKIRISAKKRPLQDYVTLVFFSDYGWGKKISVADYEQKDFRLWSLGTGLRIRMFENTLLRLEWGFPLGVADEPNTEEGNSRFHFSLDFDF